MLWRLNCPAPLGTIHLKDRRRGEAPRSADVWEVSFDTWDI